METQNSTIALLNQGGKPVLTLCLLCKSDICAPTVASLLGLINCAELNKIIALQPTLAVGQSDLPKARSEQLTNWYQSANSGDYFMFIDADQTFKPKDIFRSLLYILQYDVVCGAYSRKNGTMTVEPKDTTTFYDNQAGELWYGSTGFMLISYGIVDKIAKHFGKLTRMSLKTSVYPFFYERIIDEPELNRKELWLSEDYSFCWLVRQHGGKIFGHISTVGHIIPNEFFVQLPDKVQWDDKSIVIYCGPTTESWDPSSLKERGLGGSETAVVKLAPLWVKEGYNVHVFCNCPKPGVFEGVHYHHEHSFNFTDNFNILIVWRNLEVLNLLTVKANLCIVDLHDIVKPELLTERVRKNVNRYCVKSRYHATMLPGVPENRIFVIPNGGAFNTPSDSNSSLSETHKDPNYLIYSSSYDRGIAYMLKWGWPRIKKACPDAYLHIYYGWDAFDKIRKDPDSLLYKKIVLELMNQPGVKELGRIPQEELLKEKAKASIHYYVGDFQEIDCISVRESACLKTIPVVSRFAKVFEEKSYCVLIDGDPHEQKTQEKGADKIIELLKKPTKLQKLREELVVPKEETWESTAQNWIKVFKF